MRTETIMRAMALTQMFAIPIGCGSSGTSVTTGGATVAGASSAGGGTSNGAGTSTGGAGGSTGSSTGGGPAELGAACTFNSNGDTCVTYDLECTAEIKWVLCEGLDYPCPPADYTFLEGGSGTCALPQEFAGCSPSIGCQDGGFGGSPGLACSPGFPVTGGSTAVLCTYSCTSSLDCANISESCQTFDSNQRCSYNYCDVSDGQLVGPFWNACDAAGSGDGECLPYGGNPPEGAVCYQNGSVADGDLCMAYRTQGSTSGQCVFGDFCVPEPDNQDVGVCMRLTDGPDGGHPCPTASDLTLTDVIGANFSICAQDCSNDPSCPPNLTCQSVPGGQACVP